MTTSAAVKARLIVSRLHFTNQNNIDLLNALNAASVCFLSYFSKEIILIILMYKSTGSSTVIIFAVLVLFISFTIAARVVDLPDPVGPVTTLAL